MKHTKRRKNKKVKKSNIIMECTLLSLQEIRCGKLTGISTPQGSGGGIILYPVFIR